MNDAQSGASSSWWQRLARSQAPELICFGAAFVMIAAWVALLVLGVSFAGIDVYFWLAIGLSLTVVLSLWVMLLRLGMPRAPDATARPSTATFRNKGWVGASVVLWFLGLIVGFVIYFTLRPSPIPLPLGLALGVAGFVLLLVGIGKELVLRLRTPESYSTSPPLPSGGRPRLVLVLSVPLLLGTVGVVGWLVVDAPTYIPAYTLGSNHGYIAAAYSPGGRYLATESSSDTVAVWDVVSRRQVWQAPCSNGFGDVEWSPDGTYLAANCLASVDSSASPDFKITVWLAATGAPMAADSFDMGTDPFAGSFAWSPTGRQIAVLQSSNISGINEIVFHDVSDGRIVRTLPLPNAALTVAWSPDGQYIAAAGQTVDVITADTGAETAEYNGSVEGALRLVWSPDSSHLAVIGGRAGADYDTPHGGAVDVWDVATGRHLLSVITDRGDPAAPFAWSPDGREVVVGMSDLYGVARVYDVATGSVVFTWRGQSGGIQAVAWSPDGRSIASGTYNGPIAVWHPVQV